jgi:sulfur carrier protein ThiS
MGYPVRSRFLDLFAVQGFSYVGPSGPKGKIVLDLRPDTEPTFRLITEPWYRRIPREIARAGEPDMAEPEFRYPELPHKQRQIYDAIAKTGIAELADRDLVTDRGITAFTRMCQLAGSMIRIEDAEDPLGFTIEGGVVERVLPSHKIADLLEFLGDEDGQWIVGLNSKPLAVLAERKLAEAGIAVVHILGGMSTDAKDAAMLTFERGEARVIIINEAGREAIDLPSAEGVYWLEPNPSYVHREQIEGRGDRFGRTVALRRVYALTPGTVDVRLYEMGLDKEGKHQRVVQDAAVLRWAMSVAPDEINEDTERIRT